MSGDATTLLDRLAPAHPDEAPGSRASRGRAWLAEHGLPGPRDEAWRYTPLHAVIAAFEGAEPAPDGGAVARRVTRADVDRLAGDHGGPRLVLVNGALVASLSDLDRAGAGLWLGGAEGLAPRPRPAGGREDQPVDGFHALNWAAGRDVAAVLVDPGAHPDGPVHVVHVSLPAGGGPSASHPRTVLRAGAGARVHLIESYVALGGPVVTNASTRVVAGEGAEVTLHRVQAEDPGTTHLGRTGIVQAAGSRVRATSFSIGAATARTAVDVVLAGDDARADLDGLYLPSDRQRHDTVVTVDHRASRGTSVQRFRGIVDDHARGSFSGHVIVRPGTTGTDARQSNHNLVLTPTAQADTRPWLEIFADDVRCAHGATVGRLDDDALFYLRSRGIPEAEARAVLVAAFAAEIVDVVDPPSLRDLVARAGHLPPGEDPS